MTFSILLGQDKLRQALKRSVSAGAVSQATLLAGPQGSGKKSWGKALAQALLCSRSRQNGGDACSDCRSCRLFGSGNHPNFTLLEPRGSSLKVEQLREIRGRFYLAGAPGSLRACLIAEADRMTPEACSALLKVLEEPPDGLFFILTSSRQDRLLATVASRCRRYTLLPLEIAEIERLLIRQDGFSAEKAELIARCSGGLPGQALAMAGDPLFDERLQIAKQLFEALTAGGNLSRKLLKQVSLLETREDLLPLLEFVYLLLRDQLVWSACGEEHLLINPPAGDPPQPVSPDDLLLFMETVNQAIGRLAMTNVNRKLALEGMYISLQRRNKID